MLSLFPQLLFLTPLAITLLRVSAGCVLLSLAWGHFSKRAQLADVPFIIVGRGMWIPLFAATFELVVGGLLIAGAFTQAAAIVGALLSLKQLTWHRRYPALFALQPSAAFLLFVLCASLVFMGAGAFAFDLPL